MAMARPAARRVLDSRLTKVTIGTRLPGSAMGSLFRSPWHQMWKVKAASAGIAASNRVVARTR